MSFSVIEFIDKLVESPAKAITVNSRHGMTFEQAAEYFERRDQRYELEERAAILEYDGGMDRDQAERQAVEEVMERLE